MKKFKSSAAPKGTWLPDGYQDRTALRQGLLDSPDESVTDTEPRLQVLEEMLKLQQIDQATFDNLRAKIGVGGDHGGIRMVKGLDWKLLEKARKGEDLNKPDEEIQPIHPERSVDEDLDEALAKEVRALKRSPPSTDGQHLSPPEFRPSQTLSRDEILLRLKQSRANGSMQPLTQPMPILGDHFKKVDGRAKTHKKRFIETVNGRRREVLLTTDKNGNPKRKTRWLDQEIPHSEAAGISTSAGNPLGLDLPEGILARQKALLNQQRAASDEEDDEDDGDIFQGIGSEYNPLADLVEDSEEEVERKDVKSSRSESSQAKLDLESKVASERRNYFATDESVGPEPPKSFGMNDATILEALKRAAKVSQRSNLSESAGRGQDDFEHGEEATKQQRLLEKLRQREQDDARDLDMGLGESQFGDEDDDDGPIGKTSGRKRGPKRKRGNKDNVGDVMNALASRDKIS